MKDVHIEKCPFCGGTEFVKGWQRSYGQVYAGPKDGEDLFHILCKDCGSVVRSYVAYTGAFKPYENK